MNTNDSDAVLAAAGRCVAAFGRHRRDDYFACFVPEATFIFYTTPVVLLSRAAWMAEWERLEREDGFRVLACVSRDQHVHLHGDAAIFIHRVTTRTRTNGGEVTTEERETIVYGREPDGAWMAIHEHLSAMP